MAIEMVEVKGKKYPRIDLGKCIFCYKCSDDCPSGAMKTSTAFELAAVNQTSLTQKPQQTSHDKKSPKKSWFGK
jgi:formate hydrogenlyase subunit 6/NADH:ubiquinone oxidoreductase subunit I